jgi:membrane associated rhomboid family serine protease
MEDITLNIVLIAGIVIISFMAFNNADLKFKLLHNPYTVKRRNEYYRLLSSGFIHADYMHLILNMWAMYLFGGVVNSYFKEFYGSTGNLYFLILFFVGIVFANIPDFMQKKDLPHYSSLGASGGVSSIVFASIILSPLSRLMMFPIPIPMPAYVFAVIYVAYSIYMDKRNADNINHMAHLWGALWGVAFMFLLEPGSLLFFFEQIKSSLLN